MGGRPAHGPRRPGARGAHAGAVHGRHGDDAGRRGAAAGRRVLMLDATLYRRLLRQARPYWLHLAALFGIGLLASPIALLNPVPLKIVVDSVLGSRPLPAWLAPAPPPAAAPSPAHAFAGGVAPLMTLPALPPRRRVRGK